MTYGNALCLSCLATDGLSPEGTAVLATRENIASGELAANVRPLRLAKPQLAGVPTTYEMPRYAHGIAAP
jgi:hypothetical protein